jgi:archaellum component FlaC
MSTTETKELTDQISQLHGRISALVDEVAVLTNDVQRFKKAVADDVKYLTDRVDDPRQILGG